MNENKSLNGKDGDNQQMDGESGSEGDFSLYTEKIVESKNTGLNKIIQILKVIGMLCMVIVLLLILTEGVIPAARGLFIKDSPNRDELSIEKDSYDTTSGIIEKDERLDLNSQEDPNEIPKDEDYNHSIEALRTRVSEVQKSIVAIDLKGNDLSSLVEEESSETETSALIIGYVNSEYIMITSADAIGDANEVIVQFSTLEEARGVVRDKNVETDIALISVHTLDMSYSMIRSIKVATLDNSYNVQQGDLTLLAGRIYGQNKAVDYGTITDISSRISIDNTFEIFNTNLLFNEGDFCFAFNVEGSVIGVSTISQGSNLKIFGISDLKSMIEAMANKGGLAYCGVWGQTVTGAMVEQYGLPMGIYISAVAVDSPAYRAGLQAGDVIYGINGNSVLTIQAFSEKLYQCSNGQSINIMAKRQGKDGYHDVNFDVIIRIL